jgi:hypothetical protein
VPGGIDVNPVISSFSWRFWEKCTSYFEPHHRFFNPLLVASCTDTVKLLEAWRGVLSSTPPYK